MGGTLRKEGRQCQTTSISYGLLPRYYLGLGSLPDTMGLYTCMVRPALTYGHHVWAHCIRHKWQKLKLRRLNAIATKLMGPFRRGTPHAGLEMITYTPPIELFLTRRSCENIPQEQRTTEQMLAWLEGR